MYDVNCHIMYAIKRSDIRNDLWLYTNGLHFIVYALLSVRSQYIRRRFHLVLAFSFVHHPLHAFTLPPSRTDGLLSLVNGVAKPAGIRDKFYDFHSDTIHQSVPEHAHSKHDTKANVFDWELGIHHPSRHRHLSAWTVCHRTNKVLHAVKDKKLPVNWWVCTYGMVKSTFSPPEGSSTRMVVTKRLRFRPCFCNIYCSK